MHDVVGRCQRIVNLDAHAEALELAHDVDDLGVADIGHVFLEGDAQDRDQAIGAIAQRQAAHAFARDPLAHAVIDATAGQHDFRMVAGFFRAIGQIVGIDPDAVAADQARAGN